ncbi:MAG: hypothetical protein AB7F35_00525 [Acetobacteraceae bacterium]
MATNIVTRGIQGPPGPAGAPGGTQPIAPGSIDLSMLKPGVVPSTTDGLTQGSTNKYLTGANLKALINDTDSVTATLEEDGTISFTAAGGGEGGGPANTDGLPQGSTNLYATASWLNSVLLVSTGLTKSYNAGTGKVTLTGTAGGGASLSPSDRARLDNIVLFDPSDPTGATDMSGELEALAAANPYRCILFKQGITPLINAAFQGDNSTDIVINLNGCTVLYDNSCGFSIYADNTANAGPEVAVSSITEAVVHTDARVSQINLSAASPSGWEGKRFDRYALYSDNANPAKSGGKLGEIFPLFDDESGQTLIANRRLNRHGSYSSNVKVRKLNKTRKFMVFNGTFKANGNPQSHSITTRAGGIFIQGFVDPVWFDLTFDAPWSEGVQFKCTSGARFWNITVKNIGNLANYLGYTYGNRAYGMNDGFTGEALVVWNGRHPAFTSDGNGSSTTTWYNKGIPTNGIIDGVIGFYTHGSVIDTHEEGDRILFRNVVDFYPYQDADISGSFTGLGAQLRSANTVIDGFVCVGGTRGIKINAVDHGFEDQIELRNIRIGDLTATATTDGDTGIQIDDQNSLTNKRHVYIDGAHMNNVGRCVTVGRKALVTITGLHGRRFDTFIDAAAGCDVSVAGPAHCV